MKKQKKQDENINQSQNSSVSKEDKQLFDQFTQNQTEMTFSPDQIEYIKNKQTLDTIQETIREDRISSMCPSLTQEANFDRNDNFNTPDFLITCREENQDFAESP